MPSASLTVSTSTPASSAKVTNCARRAAATLELEAEGVAHGEIVVEMPAKVAHGCGQGLGDRGKRAEVDLRVDQR